MDLFTKIIDVAKYILSNVETKSTSHVICPYTFGLLNHIMSCKQKSYNKYDADIYILFDELLCLTLQWSSTEIYIARYNTLYNFLYDTALEIPNDMSEINKTKIGQTNHKLKTFKNCIDNIDKISIEYSDKLNMICYYVLNNTIHIFDKDFKDAKEQELFIKLYFYRLLVDIKCVSTNNSSQYDSIKTNIRTYFLDINLGRIKAFWNEEYTSSQTVHPTVIYKHIKQSNKIQIFVETFCSILEPYYIAIGKISISNPLLIELGAKLNQIYSLVETC